LVLNPLPQSWHSTKHLNSVPSKDGWTDGKNKHLGRRIPKTLDHWEADELGRAPPYG
jgi:hypothetical protein